MDMGVAKPLDQQINHYLVHLSTEQKQVVLSVVKTFAGKEEAWWDDEKYTAEMNRRFAEMESCKVKGKTLEEIEAGGKIGI